MCNFFSFVVTKGKLHAYFGVNSHEDIIELAGISHLDKPEGPQLVRCELTPDNPMTLNFKKWEFRVDQDLIPDWFDAEEWHEKAVNFLKKVPQVKKTQTRGLVTENLWFCAGE